MKKATFGDRLRYRFDNFMSRGTIALVGALFGVTFALILIATLILVVARLNPAGDGAPLGFPEALWQVTMRTIDTGTVAGDTGWPSRLVGFGITLGGIFIASALIGVLASGLEGRLSDLRRGRSRVIEEGHTVILGWSPQVFTLVSELAMADRRRSGCAAILADKDKVEMEEEIRAKAPEIGGFRVVCRSGNPLDPDDLAIVSPDTSRAIVVVSPGGPYPDLPIAKTMMALGKDRESRAVPYHIVTAIHRPANLQIIRMIGGAEAQVFMVDGLISRLTAQTCRQAGLSVVYAELFSFEGAAIDFHAEPSLAGSTYGEALSRYRNVTVLGLQYGDGQVQLNPPMETVIRPGDKVIGIALDSAAFAPSEPPPGSVDAAAIRDAPSAALPLERLLILGWNRRAPFILEQLGYYMPPDSQVTIVAPYDPEQMRAEAGAGRSQPMRVTFEKGNPVDRATLERLAGDRYQFIIILSSTDAPDIQLADASTMISLLHLRDIAAKTGQSPSIVSEVLDVRNRDLAEVTRADDVIISERLVALALAQIAENKDVVPVLVELLTPGGPEIYLKPAGEYVETGRPLSFYTVVEAARRKGQTALGYRLLDEASQSGRAFGVHLNPDKAAPVTFSADDRVIVLADE
jgi:voltage-gated potassium channel Kch